MFDGLVRHLAREIAGLAEQTAPLNRRGNGRFAINGHSGGHNRPDRWSAGRDVGGLVAAGIELRQGQTFGHRLRELRSRKTRRHTLRKDECRATDAPLLHRQPGARRDLPRQVAREVRDAAGADERNTPRRPGTIEDGVEHQLVEPALEFLRCDRTLQLAADCFIESRHRRDGPSSNQGTISTSTSTRDNGTDVHSICAVFRLRSSIYYRLNGLLAPTPGRTIQLSEKIPK